MVVVGLVLGGLLRDGRGERAMIEGRLRQAGQGELSARRVRVAAPVLLLLRGLLLSSLVRDVVVVVRCSSHQKVSFRLLRHAERGEETHA